MGRSRQTRERHPGGCVVIEIVDRMLILPRRDGGILVVPSFERIKDLAKKMLCHLQLGNAAESDLLKLLFLNTPMANVGNAAGLVGSGGTGSPGSIFVALHTATPGAGGTQNTNEAAYTNYARVAVARTAGGWTITGSSPTTAENTAAVTFPQSGSGPETEAWFSTGQETSGAGELYWFGSLGSSLVVNNLITPSFALNALTNTLL
jgi:hypothetical protein